MIFSVYQHAEGDCWKIAEVELSSLEELFQYMQELEQKYEDVHCSSYGCISVSHE